MKKLINTLADAAILPNDYREFLELFHSIFQITTAEDNDVQSLAIAVNNQRIFIDSDGISFTEYGRYLRFSELLDYMKMLRELLPFIPDEDDDGTLDIPPLSFNGGTTGESSGNAEINDLVIALNSTWSSSKISVEVNSKASVEHTQSIDSITGLQSALNGKAAVNHLHTIDAVTGLQTALDGKAATNHTQGIDTITGLQAALDGKAATNHTQGISSITGLQAALDAKAAIGHTHAITDITNLQTTLDGKAPTNHTQAISTITGLQTALDGKAATTDTRFTDARTPTGTAGGELAGTYPNPTLSVMPGLTAGTYFAATPTIDTKGRITAVKDFDPYKEGIVYEHFLNTSTSMGGSFGSSGGNGVGTLTMGADGVDHPGNWTFHTANTSTGYAFYRFSSSLAISVGGGEWFYRAVVKIPTSITYTPSGGSSTTVNQALPTTAENYFMFFGFSDSNGQSGLPIDGMGFYLDVNSTRWFARTHSNNATTPTNNASTNVIVTVGTWYDLRFVVNAAGTSCSFWVNGSMTNTFTTGLPPNTRRFGALAHVVKSAGTAARGFQMDYTSVKWKLN